MLWKTVCLKDMNYNASFLSSVPIIMTSRLYWGSHSVRVIDWLPLVAWRTYVLLCEFSLFHTCDIFPFGSISRGCKIFHLSICCIYFLSCFGICIIVRWHLLTPVFFTFSCATSTKIYIFDQPALSRTYLWRRRKKKIILNFLYRLKS